MTDAADDHPPTPANDDDVFRAIEMMLFKLLRSRREMLDCDVSVLPPDRQRWFWDTFQELDTMIGRTLSYMESRSDWFRHKL